MKTLCLFLLTLTLTLTGCGSDATMPQPECVTSTDCPGTQKCDLGVCIDQECWGDNDCEKSFRCANGVCVEKPECVKDEECDAAQGLVCLEYKCTPYATQDSCNGLACTDMCQNCGPLTHCYESKCQDVCAVFNTVDNISKDQACSGLDKTCPVCHCWNDGHQPGELGQRDSFNNTCQQSSGEWTCKPITDSIVCSQSMAIIIKDRIVDNGGVVDFSQRDSDLTANCNLYCK